MKSTVEISDDLSRRIERLTRRTALTSDRIIEDALSQGRSLAWQEKWAAGVQAGLLDADAGNFAAPDEVATVLGKYGAV